MTDTASQPRKRIVVDAPSEMVVLAARHLDATEGPVQISRYVDASTRAAITTVLRYVAEAHNSPSVITDRVLSEVLAERIRQDGQFGEQNHPDLSGAPEAQCDAREMFGEWADNYRAINAGQFDPRDTDRRLDWTGILLEEVYEALTEADPAKLRAELVQVAAVAVAWVEAIDRRTQPDTSGAS